MPSRAFCLGSGFRSEWLTKKTAQVPLADFITRQFFAAFQKIPRGDLTGNGGRFFIARPGQQILSRSSVRFYRNNIEIRIRMGLPANFRKIDAEYAATMFFQTLPEVVTQAGFFKGGEQVERVEPLRKRRMRPLEGRPLHGANLVAAPLAAIDGALTDAMKLGADATAWAVQRLAVADLHKMIQAGIVVRELLEEFVNRRCLGHARVLLLINMGRAVT